jgi:hypothetical protein
MQISKLIEKWAFNDTDAKELNDLKAEQAKGAPYRVEDARRERELEMRNKAETSAPQTPVVTKKVTVAVCKSAADANTACSCGCGDTVKTCKCGPDCKCRKPGGSCYKTENTTKESAIGLWDRIRAKKERGGKAAKPGDKDYPDAKSWKKVTAISEKKADTPAWQRSAGKNEEGGLNEAGRKSYEREHGGNLKPPVTEANPSGDRAKRQNSFCSRMCGMKKHETGSETKNDPNSRINKSLSKWNCKCSSAMEFGAKLARCWSGYEPVPGAKKFSKGSCRPTGSKKTQKEMKKS